MYKIGAVTVGQSPRADVTADIAAILGENIEIIEKGALDGLRIQEIEKFAPVGDEYVLVSRLRDGTEVRFAERHIIPRLQECILALEQEGVKAILIFCTGRFPKFKAAVPLIFPNTLLQALVPALIPEAKIAVVTPNKAQLAQSEVKWRQYAREVFPVAASPYQNAAEALDIAAERINELDGIDFIVMDCIGYSLAMKQRLKERTGKKVLLARTVMARVAKELLD